MSLDSGLENCVCFIRLKKLVYQNIYSIRYHKTTIITTVGQLRMVQRFIAEQMYSNILFFPHTILEWKKYNMQIRRSESFLSFENSLLKIDQPAAKPTYSIHNPIGLKFLIRLRLG